MSRAKVGILIFDDVEVLDFCGPFEVFSVTYLSASASREAGPAYDVCLVSQGGDSITTRGGMKVAATCSMSDCPPLDVLVVPGGQGTRREVSNNALLRWIDNHSKSVKFLTSVCTGSFLLAEAGLLDGKSATTHWKSLDRMKDTYPAVHVDYDSHVVIDGKTFTSAGISAGIDMALLVIAADLGEEVARNTARQMEYHYPDSNERRVSFTT